MEGPEGYGDGRMCNGQRQDFVSVRKCTCRDLDRLLLGDNFRAIGSRGYGDAGDAENQPAAVVKGDGDGEWGKIDRYRFGDADKRSVQLRRRGAGRRQRDDRYSRGIAGAGSARLPFVLVNNYGPTECTVVATSGVVVPAESNTRPPSIGRAIDNTEVYILDDQMKPVTPGNAGELYIGGASVARGYRGRPDLTAEKFVGNPARSDSSSLSAAATQGRLYRTGDLVRELPGGELEFLGRIDEQIKIRGYRIEPSEIVSALDASPDVDASAVMARENGAGEKQLVAYVVLAEGVAATAGGLQELLRKQLPDYMIPSTFVRIKSLPVTSNGKVDWSALPLPLNGNVLRTTATWSHATSWKKR